MVASESGEMVPVQDATTNAIAYFNDAKMMRQLEAALPDVGLTPERLVRQVTTLIRSSPTLVECNFTTLVGAVVECAQIGLELSKPLGEAYILPFREKNRRSPFAGQRVATLVPGYKGLIKLVRSGEVTEFSAHVVREKDVFEIQLGTEKKIIHRIDHRLSADERGSIEGAYAVAKTTRGGVEFEYMNIAEIERVRVRSPGGGTKDQRKNVWASDYEAMVRKTVARKLANWLPKSDRGARAIELAGKADSGKPEIVAADVEEIRTEEPGGDAATSALDELADAIETREEWTPEDSAKLDAEIAAAEENENN